jgi:MFS family permease
MRCRRRSLASLSSQHRGCLHLMSRTFPADFWRLWSVGLIFSIVRWLETVVVGVVVYRETDSPFLVSVVTMLRLLPMGLFGAFLGAFVERFDRRLMLAAMMALLALTSVVLAMIAALGTLQVWHRPWARF